MGSGNWKLPSPHIFAHYNPQNSRQIPPGSEDPWSAAQKWSQDAEVVPIMIHVINRDSRHTNTLWHYWSSSRFSAIFFYFFTNLINAVCLQMLQSVIYRGVRLQKLSLKDLHFLSRTFADLPNIRGDGQNSKTIAKPPDTSPVQQKGKILLVLMTLLCSLWTPQMAHLRWNNKMMVLHRLRLGRLNQCFLA